MRKSTVLFIFVGALVFNAAVSAHDFSEPQLAVDAYIKAVSTGSGKHITMAYTEDATIKFYDQQQRFHEFTRDSFAEAVDTGNEWDAKIEITELLVTGNAANATVEFTWGEDAQHGYVDYLNLIYSNDSWHITNKVAQYVSRAE